MRVRVYTGGHLVRLTAFAAWLAFAAVTPLAAVGLGMYAAIGVVLSVIVNGRLGTHLGLQNRLARMLTRRLDRALASGRRVEVRFDQPASSVLVSLLAGFGAWLVPLFAGAYALKHPGPGSAMGAIALLAATAFVFGRHVLGSRKEALVLGADGYRADGRFVPYARMSSVKVSDVPSPDLEEADLVIGVEGDAAPEVHRLPVAAARRLGLALRARRAAPRATSSERLADASPYRDEGGDVEALVQRLRDGALPRDTRIRIAETLAATAPAGREMLDDLAADTADVELASALRALRR